MSSSASQNASEEAAAPKEKTSETGMIKLLRDLRVDDYIDGEYEILSENLKQLRDNFNFEKSNIVDEELRKKEEEMKTFFDPKMAVKSMALDIQNFELFKKSIKMTDEDAKQVMNILVRNDYRNRQSRLDQEYSSSSTT